MDKTTQLEMAVRLLAAEISAGRIKATEEGHYHDEISTRILTLFGLVEDWARSIGLERRSD